MIPTRLPPKVALYACCGLLSAVGCQRAWLPPSEVQKAITSKLQSASQVELTFYGNGNEIGPLVIDDRQTLNDLADSFRIVSDISTPGRGALSCLYILHINIDDQTHLVSMGESVIRYARDFREADDKYEVEIDIEFYEVLARHFDVEYLGDIVEEPERWLPTTKAKGDMNADSAIMP